MNFPKKVTVLFPPDLFSRLTRLAQLQGVSLGELVRRACKERYGLESQESRLAAVRDLERMSLPVCDPDQMKRESVPNPALRRIQP